MWRAQLPALADDSGICAAALGGVVYLPDEATLSPIRRESHRRTLEEALAVVATELESDTLLRFREGDEPFGHLRGTPVTVTDSHGVALHAVGRDAEALRRFRAVGIGPGLTPSSAALPAADAVRRPATCEPSPPSRTSLQRAGRSGARLPCASP